MTSREQINQQQLDRTADDASLASSAVRGTAWTLGSQWIRLAITLGSTVILARLLTPEDYGLIGMVQAVVGIAALLLHLGLSQATIQRDHLTHAQVNVLFWLNAAVGLLIAAVVTAGAGLLADFYGRPEVRTIAIAMSASFVFGGLTVQHQAILNRQMRFGALSIVEVVSLAVGVGVGIAMAASGFGYWSLVGMNVADHGSRAILSWITCPWRPSWPRRTEGVGDLLRFGAGLSVFSLVNYVSRNADNVLIGRAWGADALGAYSRAYRLLLMPLDQLTGPVARVALPTLSALQNEPDRFRRYYRTAISTIAFAAVPLMVVLGVMAEDVVAVLLGSQWAEAGPIFQVLAIAGVSQTVASSNGWLYVSTNRAGAQAIWGLISRPLIVLSFAIGLPWGPYGVAVSYTLMSYALLLPGFWSATRNTPIAMRDVATAVWRPVVASAVVGLSTWWVREAFIDAALVTRIVVAGLVSLATFAGMLAVIPGARTEVRGLVDAIRRGMRRSEGADS